MEMDWVKIPSGSFEFKGHGRNSKTTRMHARVTEFKISRFLISQHQWYGVMKSKPWLQFKSEIGYSEGDSIPAVGMNREEAIAFCTRLSDAIGSGVCLPTEVQWEYSIRAGTNTEFFWGDDYKLAGEFSWTWDGKTPTESLYLHEIAKLRPNPWGIFDMSGNVREWVRDHCDISSNSPYIADDHYPKESTNWVSTSGDLAIVRNASFKSSALSAASHFNKVVSPDDRSLEIGFRLVCQEEIPTVSGGDDRSRIV